MPEGDTLYRIARRLAPALEGQTVMSARGQADRGLDFESLRGATVTSVTARGKHLLIELADGRAIHSHLRMTGSWHLYRRGERWSKPSTLAVLALETAEWEAVCFSAPDVRVLTAKRLRRDTWLGELGPDLLGPQIDLDDVVLRIQVAAERALGEVVMDQRIASGIGNVYKSESLFLAKLDPWARVGELSRETLSAYLVRVRKLMLRNRVGGRRRTRFATDGPALWVYGRSGELCLKCGETVRMRRQGAAGRSTYWCPACQGRR
jgi:endonuclease-8